MDPFWKPFFHFRQKINTKSKEYILGVAKLSTKTTWKEMLKQVQELRLKLRKRLNQRTARCSAPSRCTSPY